MQSLSVAPHVHIESTHLRVAIDCRHNDFAQRVNLDLVRALLQCRAEICCRGCFRSVLKDQGITRSLRRRHVRERRETKGRKDGRSTPPWRSRDGLLYSVCGQASHDSTSIALGDAHCLWHRIVYTSSRTGQNTHLFARNAPSRLKQFSGRNRAQWLSDHAVMAE